MKSAAVVIPTFNEEGSIGILLDALTQNARITDIIIVDDSSTDATREKILGREKRDPRIQLINRQGARNFGESYRAGFLAALKKGADHIIQMDADGSHPPDALNQILDGLETNDFVVGSRFIRAGQTTGRNAPRRAVSRLGNYFAKRILKTYIQDMTGGFNGWRAEVLRKLSNETFPYRGFVIQIWLKEQSARHYTWKEIPIHFQERTHGISKFTPGIFWEGMFGVMQMRLNKRPGQKQQ